MLTHRVSEIERACSIIAMSREEVECDEKAFELSVQRYLGRCESDVVRETTIFVDWNRDAYLGKWFLLARQETGRVFQVARFIGREESEPFVFLEFWKFKSFQMGGKSRLLITARHEVGYGDTDSLRDFPTQDMDAATWELYQEGRLDATAETQYERVHMNAWSGMFVELWETDAMEEVIPAGRVNNDYLSSPKFEVPFLVKVDLAGRLTEVCLARFFPEWLITNALF